MKHSLNILLSITIGISLAGISIDKVSLENFIILIPFSIAVISFGYLLGLNLIKPMITFSCMTFLFGNILTIALMNFEKPEILNVYSIETFNKENNKKFIEFYSMDDELVTKKYINSNMSEIDIEKMIIKLKKVKRIEITKELKPFRKISKVYKLI